MINERKLKEYLNWLEDNQRYNAEERERNGMDSRVNRECERVARMLLDKIEDGDFSE